MHRVKNAFMSRAGQFGEGRKLCVGISLSALRAKTVYEFILCRRKYSANSDYVIGYSKEFNSMWQNKRGNTVVIVPVEIFDSIEIEQPKPKESADEDKKPESVPGEKEVQMSLWSDTKSRLNRTPR